MIRILPFLAGVFDVELATLRSGGPLESEVPADVVIHRIGSLGWFTAAWRLRRLFSRRRHAVVLSFQEAANIPVLLAVASLGRAQRPRVAMSTQSAPSVVLADARPRTRWRLTMAMRRLYPVADRLIAPTEGVSRDLASLAPAVASRIRVIPNAGIDETVAARLQQRREAQEEQLIAQALLEVHADAQRRAGCGDVRRVARELRIDLSQRVAVYPV